MYGFLIHNSPLISVLVLSLLAISAEEGSNAPSFDQPRTTTVKVTEGQTAFFNCNVHNIGEKTVTWVRHHNNHIELLTYGLVSFHDNKRFNIRYEYPRNWNLRISPARSEDSGRYECQISTHPPTIKTIFLSVIKPQITVRDDRGDIVRELYATVGSVLSLECLMQPTSVYTRAHPFWTLNGTRLRPKTAMNIRTEAVKRENSISLWLHLRDIRLHDAGIYSCTSKGSRGYMVILNVINAESMSSSTTTQFNPYQRHLAFIVAAFTLLRRVDR